MKKIKGILNEIFIDGLSGMALGLFSTLLVGTILGQIGQFIHSDLGLYIVAVSNVAKTITGAGIGVGVAAKLKQGPLVTVSAAVCGMIGAFPSVTAIENYAFGKGGEPLGAFVAALVAIEIGRLVAGKTPVDILITPILSICSGAVAGIFVGPYISQFMTWLGGIVNVNVEAHPFIGGIIIAVLMGMILTLPISSAAIGISMGITGIAAGAATIGCCCQMVGFAVASFKENKTGGLVAQGLGTSMLQVPNIIKNPLIWIPSILSSAILAPISSCILNMASTPVGSGMGSCGLVGQIAVLQTMTETTAFWVVMAEIAVMHFILPGLLTWIFAKLMYKLKWIKSGDMKLDI